MDCSQFWLGNYRTLNHSLSLRIEITMGVENLLFAHYLSPFETTTWTPTDCPNLWLARKLYWRNHRRSMRIFAVGKGNLRNRRMDAPPVGTSSALSNKCKVPNHFFGRTFYKNKLIHTAVADASGRGWIPTNYRRASFTFSITFWRGIPNF
jgi:hypothetical protein